MKKKPTKKQIRFVMLELGRRGGLKGGPARKRVLSPERRTEIARYAANIRHGKVGK